MQSRVGSGDTAAAGASDHHAYPGGKQHIAEFLLWKGRIQPSPALWKVSKSLQADREAQHIKCVSSLGREWLNTSEVLAVL